MTNVTKDIYRLSFILHSVILKYVAWGSTEPTKERLNPKNCPKALFNFTLFLLKVLVLPPG